MMFYTYILQCNDGTLYVGSTNDLPRRIHQHNHAKSGAHYTKIRRPVVLRYTQQHETYALARACEARLKRLSRHAKLVLITEPHIREA